MSDIAHKYTTKEIAELRKQITAIYREAEKDIQKKMDDFNARYKVKEQKYLQEVAAGVMSQKEFDQWKAGQVFQGQQWQAKKDDIINTIHHSNEIATKMINGDTQNVFAMNANYMSYELEHSAGINFGFDIYDSNAVSRLIKDDPRLLPKWKIDEPKDYTWNQKKVNNAITQGIIQGESLDKISKRLAHGLATQNKNKMNTFARTAMTGAQNSGRQMQLENAKKMGIDVLKEWMASLDGHTRDSHAEVDGEQIEVDKKFSNGLMFPGEPGGAPAEVYNCFIPETNIASDCEIIRSYRHWYSGKVVSIKSSMGVNFTCTPNHPILTDRGWIVAKFLNKGDHLIVTSGINNEVSRRNPNINHAFPAINTIHQLFDKFGGERTSVLGVNFHGDVATSDVEVITQERFLGTNFDTGTGKSVNKFLLKYTNTSFMSKGSFMEHFRRIVRSSFSNIGSIGEVLPFFKRSLGHSDKHRFGPIPNMNIGLTEYSINNLSTDSDFFSKSLIGLTGKIFLDDIISVDVSDFTGHVYNLQTKNNYYFVNNSIKGVQSYNSIFAIAHNCRCTMASELKKYPSVYNRYDNRTGERIRNMSYRDWKDAKKNGKNMAPYNANTIANKYFFGSLSQNGAYVKIHDLDVTLANQFYKTLQNMGKDYAEEVKAAKVWQDYVNGDLPKGISSDKLDEIIAKYRSKASNTLITPQKTLNEPVKAPKTPRPIKPIPKPKNADISKFKTTEEWLDAIKKNPNARDMLKAEKKLFETLSDAEKRALKDYTGNAYRSMNNYLRLLGTGMPESEAVRKAGLLDMRKDEIELCKKALNTMKLDRDMVFRRGTDFGDLAGLFMKGDFNENKRLLAEKSAEELNEMFRGEMGIYFGFTSTSSQWDRGFSGKVEVIINAPKGTPAASIMSISNYGTSEGETLLNANTKVRCEKIEKSDGHFSSRIRMFLTIIN